MKIIPQSRGLPFLGNFLRFMRAGGAPKLHKYIDQKHNELGCIFKEKLGNVEAVFISNAEMMRSTFGQEGKYPMHVFPEAWTLYNQLYGCARGLFFMNNEEWLFNRRWMNNLLLKSNLSFIDEATNCTAFNVRECVGEEGEVNDLEDKLYKWSLDTITAILVGPQTFVREKRELDGKLLRVSHQVRKIFETSSQLQFISAGLASKYRLKVWKRFETATDDALNSTADLVYFLMKRFPANDGLLFLMNKNGVVDVKSADVMKIVIDLILAAGDTTAYTMQWILHCLSTNRAVQEEANLNSRNVIKEAMRLYPTAPFLTRITADNVNISSGDQMYTIPKNSLLIFSVYTMGRDNLVYSKADQFLPSRWEDKSVQMSQAHQPFALGIRSCIGKKIAELQLKNTLEKITKEYFVEPVDKEDDVEMTLKMVSVPSKPLRLKFTKKY